MNQHQIITRSAMAMIMAGFFWSHSICHAVLILTSNPNPPQNVPYLGAHVTTGEDMTGMTVTAYFSGAAPETANWMATGNPLEGQAVGAGGDWSLTQSDDSYSFPWKLQYQQQGKGVLTGLSLDGMAGGVLENQVVFDRTKDALGDFTGTPDSALGRDFVTDPNLYPHFNIHADYSGEVKVSTEPSAYGDIYRFLNLQFKADDVAGHVNIAGLDGYDIHEMVFYQDTDRLSRVPEPSSLAMGFLGLGMMVCRPGRKSKTSKGSARHLTESGLKRDQTLTM